VLGYRILVPSRLTGGGPFGYHTDTNMDTRFAKFVQAYRGRLAMPLCAYSGLEITGESVEDMVTVPGSQFKAIMALDDRYRTPVLLTAVDTTVEAEAYGCEVKIPARQAPSIVGRLVTSAADIALLNDPVPGDARTRVPLETAWRLTAEVGENVPVIGTMVGPFALASRLFGMNETMEAITSEPETIESLLDIVTGFLCRYALEFRETGAWGVLVVEAMAGKLSPEGLARFSVPFFKRIVKAAETEDFAIIVHNCNASLDNLDAVLDSGASVFHFGPPMDMAAALAKVGPGIVLGGNLDSTLFEKGTQQAMADATRTLLDVTRPFKNFVLSSGCDIPPGSPLGNLNSFFRAVAEFNKAP
jgi:uroporphyrinogen decarboxylase